VSEARLEDSGSGLAPASGGWFVVNVSDAMWLTFDTRGSLCVFESFKTWAYGPESGVLPRQLGINLTVGASVREETSDPEQAYAGSELARLGRPASWDRLPWA
jgi:hypothetical protein